ncbi:hypothetical protein K431DRAFT_341142 [Polychaeton citri CBS 116435]|uniref:Tocopherol cyclase n=1 Tax=Polychaeton citri CBS 116435 TaxID=1314669 RepID=A0A9P4PZD2_9PEZI|nr:hypothetical protein K431DRAFT_341142 [Polychaeton citri CBS 116435]
MEHNAPHANARFEGYYSKFDLPSGSHLAVIFSNVKTAQTKPHKISLTYVPKDSMQIFQKEIAPDQMELKTLSKDYDFVLSAPGVGFIKWNKDSLTEYDLTCEEFSFKGKTTTRIPWSTSTNTPEGLLAYLPLPLHWHVHSLGSQCDYSLEIPGYNLPASDASGAAIVHQEKNYALGFPSAHMWMQAQDGDHSFCAAGGQILGMEAFLLGYRSKDIDIDFRPPFAVRIAGWSPFMTYASNWNEREFRLSLQSFRQKIVVEAKAPRGSFFSLSAPFPEGHRENYLGQSFQATIVVHVYQSGWFGPWRLMKKDIFRNASLEFGAGYYPPAGSKDTIN